MGWQARPRPGQPRRAEACGGGTISICQASRTPSPAAGGRRAAADAAALADPIRATEQSLSRRLGRALAQYDGPGPHCDIIWRPVPRPPGGPSQPAERLGGRERAIRSERARAAAAATGRRSAERCALGGQRRAAIRMKPQLPRRIQREGVDRDRSPARERARERAERQRERERAREREREREREGERAERTSARRCRRSGHVTGGPGPRTS